MVLLMALAAMLVAAVAVPVLARRLHNETGYVLAVVFLGVAGLLLTQAGRILQGSTVTGSWSWVPAFGVRFSLRMDGLALLFTMLVLGVGALIMFYAPRYLRPGDDHARLFGLLTLFAGAMLGLVLANDLVLLVVFWELTTLCSFLLIAGRGRAGARPATRALVVTVGGGLALLGAVVIMGATVGTTDLATVVANGMDALSGQTGFAVGALIVVAAFTKSAQLPVHFWLPDAMVAITPVSAYLHAATLVKAGIYLLLRFSPMFADEPAWHLTLMGVGLATMIVGAFLALRQNDLKALLAYSTVSQLGLIVALVGVGTTAALAAAALHTAAHALFKATLFMLVGIIDREAGSRDLRELSGLWRVMPVTAALTGLAALSMAGVPPLVGFVSKEEAFYAFLGTPDAAWTGGAGWTGPVAAGLALAGAALTVAYSLRIVAGSFFGPTLQSDLYEPRASFLAPAAVPAIIGLALGLVPWVLNPIVNRTVIDTRFEVGDADLALWHGLTPALALSVVALAAGTALHLTRPRIDRLLPPVSDDHVGAQVFDRAWDAALGLGARVGRPTRTHVLPVHIAGAGAGLLALAGIAAVALPPLPRPAGPVAQAPDVAVLALLLPCVAALALMRSVVGAVMLLGTAGFILSVWLLALGAPDVALTLLLVEVLTVVVAVPVLRGLPVSLPPHRRRVAALASAGALGVAAGVGVLALTGRREVSPAAHYLLREGEPATGGSNVVNTVLVDFRGLDTLGELVVLAAAALGLFVLLRPGGRTADAVSEPPRDATAAGRGRGRDGTVETEAEAAERPTTEGPARQQPGAEPPAAEEPGAKRPLDEEPTAEGPAAEGPGAEGPAVEDPASDEIRVYRMTARVVLPVVVTAAVVLLLRGHDLPGGGFIAGLVGGAGVALSRLAGLRLPLPGPVRLVTIGLGVAAATGAIGLLLDNAYLRPVKLTFPGVQLELLSSLIFDVGVVLVVLGVVVAALERLGSTDSGPTVQAAEAAARTDDRNVMEVSR